MQIPARCQRYVPLDPFRSESASVEKECFIVFVCVEFESGGVDDTGDQPVLLAESGPDAVGRAGRG